MKKIVVKSETIDVGQASQNQYYGVSNGVGDKGFIARQEFEKGDFFAFLSHGITRGNQFNFRRTDNIHNMLSDMISCGFAVYEFDTPSELFYWLSVK